MKGIIPIFFACDENFVKYMMVTMYSVMEHASLEHTYGFYVLNTGISEQKKHDVTEMVNDFSKGTFKVEYVDVTGNLKALQEQLPIRDYYSKTTYYRLLIPEMFPEYDKVVYLDSDVVVLGDISEFYQYDVGDNLVGAINDQLVQQMDVFGEYVEQVLGVSRDAYFNAGVLLMNCKQLRDQNFSGKFLELLNTYTFIVAQDQDYLNVITKGKVKWLPVKWNVEASSEIEVPEDEICLIHYNMAAKPWNYEDCNLGGYFWETARKLRVYDEIHRVLENYTKEEQEMDLEVLEQLLVTCRKEIVKQNNYLKMRGNIEEKSKDRLNLIEKIAEFERAGRFDEDVEEDPPGRELKPGEVDYLHRKPKSKIKARMAYYVARKFMNHMIAEKQLIIKEIIGIDNYAELTSGAVVTCNHFNAMDSFAMQIAYEASGHKKRKLYRVIKEGNYTSFPGFYGVLMRNCNTLPLSSNYQTMKSFMDAVDRVLRKGHFVLIYPEQSMWWNYKKPKPLKRGGFTFAAKSNVPVLPVFITMEDSDVLDGDGFFVQEYTIHVAAPIYPKSELGERENANYMMEENARVWKEIYEETYQIPLEYSCEE